MKIIRAYKTRLNPNNSQITKMRMNCGASRFGFNYALAIKKAAFDKKEKIPTNIDLHRRLNKIKGTEELPWAYEVSKCSFQEALRDCDEVKEMEASHIFWKELKRRRRAWITVNG